MGIFNRVSTAYCQLKGKKYSRIKRKQFNLTIDKDIILAVKAMSASLEVPTYVVCEHILQVGCYHLVQDLDDSEKREKLIEHLVEVHLLGKDLKEEEFL